MISLLCLLCACAAIDSRTRPQPAPRPSRSHTSDSSANVLSPQRAAAVAGLAGLGLCGLILGQLIEPANYRMDYLHREREP